MHMNDTTEWTQLSYNNYIAHSLELLITSEIVI